MDRLRFIACLLLLTAQASVAPELQAQQPPGAPYPSTFEVVGTSYILPGNGSTITAYASTELGGDVQAYYDAEVDATLTEGGATVSSGTAQGDPAEGILSYPSGAAMFELYSIHSLLPAYDELCEDYGDPLGFANIGGNTGQGYMVVDAPQYEGDESGCTTESLLAVGSTYWQQYGGAPQINGISTSAPNGVTLNGSGTLTIAGLGLTADGTDPNPTVCVVSGSGLTLSDAGDKQYGICIGNSAGSDTELQVGYTVDGNASSTGAHGITVTTIAGTSNPYNLQIGDPTPVIGSVSPNQWYAGSTNLVITITGQGFGTNPCLSITPAVGLTFQSGGDGCVILASGATDQMMQTTVTVAANAPAGASTVTVQSRGYNANGFQSAQTGQSNTSNQQVVTILALIATKPYIVLGTGGGACAGSDISGQRSVQVGQQIAFTGCLPAGTSLSNVSSMLWTPTTPLGTAVGGYTTVNSGATSSGKVVALSSPSCTTAQSYCSFPTFYWLDQANGRQFTFQYTLVDGSSNQATVTFNVGGPTGVSVTATPSPTGMNIVAAGNYVGKTQLSVPEMVFGDVGVKGMKLYATATNLASGSYLWVQLVQHDRLTYLNSLGKYGPADSIAGDPAVDEAYPYGYDQQGNAIGTVTTTTVLNDTAADSPAVPLIPTYGEEERWFQATMYLMWVPTADPNCNNNGAACTIPVPQGQVGWSFAGDVINTLQPAVNQGVSYVQWAKNPNNCSGGNALSYQPSTAHPQWSAAINP